MKFADTFACRSRSGLGTADSGKEPTANWRYYCSLSGWRHKTPASVRPPPSVHSGPYAPAICFLLPDTDILRPTCQAENGVAFRSMRENYHRHLRQHHKDLERQLAMQSAAMERMELQNNSLKHHESGDLSAGPRTPLTSQVTAMVSTPTQCEKSMHSNPLFASGIGLGQLSGAVDNMLSAVDQFRTRVEGSPERRWTPTMVMSSPVGLSAVGLRTNLAPFPGVDVLPPNQALGASPTHTASLLERCWLAAQPSTTGVVQTTTVP